MTLLYISLFLYVLVFASLFQASKQILLRGWCISAPWLFILSLKKHTLSAMLFVSFYSCALVQFHQLFRIKCFDGLTRCCENVTAKTEPKWCVCVCVLYRVLVAERIKRNNQNYLFLFQLIAFHSEKKIAT